MRERPSHPVKPALRKTTLAVDVVVLSPQADTLAALLVRTALGGRERWSLPWDAPLPGEGLEDAIAVVLGGDASCATGGFWSALTIATTQQLPLLIYIEDNGYGISVPSHYQTPGCDIAANLASFRGLTIFNGGGTQPEQAAQLVRDAVAHVRTERAPALLRLTVPRLEGHSFQDTQSYKSEDEVAEEWTRDPLPKLRDYCAAFRINDDDWARLARSPRVLPIRN